MRDDASGRCTSRFADKSCGSNGAGGELGHIVIEYNGQPCSCGRKGCWEAYSSATALIRMTKEKIEECHAAGRPTLMDELVAKKGKVSGITAFAAMRDGDAAAKEVVDTYLRYLAVGLGNIVNIFQPEVISLGGGISNEGQSRRKLLTQRPKSDVVLIFSTPSDFLLFSRKSSLCFSLILPLFLTKLRKKNHPNVCPIGGSLFLAHFRASLRFFIGRSFFY